MVESVVPMEEVLATVAHGREAWKIEAFTFVSEARAIGTRVIREEDCVGHFKNGFPKVLPGALTLEMLCQVGVYTALKKFPGQVAILGNFSGRPLAPIFPGDELQMREELLEWKGRKGKARGEAFVRGLKVFEAGLEFRVVRPEILQRPHAKPLEAAA